MGCVYTVYIQQKLFVAHEKNGRLPLSKKQNILLFKIRKSCLDIIGPMVISYGCRYSYAPSV